MKKVTESKKQELLDFLRLLYNAVIKGEKFAVSTEGKKLQIPYYANISGILTQMGYFKDLNGKREWTGPVPTMQMVEDFYAMASKQWVKYKSTKRIKAPVDTIQAKDIGVIERMYDFLLYVQMEILSNHLVNITKEAKKRGVSYSSQITRFLVEEHLIKPVSKVRNLVVYHWIGKDASMEIARKLLLYSRRMTSNKDKMKEEGDREIHKWINAPEKKNEPIIVTPVKSSHVREYTINLSTVDTMDLIVELRHRPGIKVNVSFTEND